MLSPTTQSTDYAEVVNSLRSLWLKACAVGHEFSAIQHIFTPVHTEAELKINRSYLSFLCLFVASLLNSEWCFVADFSADCDGDVQVAGGGEGVGEADGHLGHPA